MFIQTEPTDLLMVRYKLYFNQHTPDPEDPWVLAYLEQHGLEPRRQLDEKHDGVPFKVLHFGQCYLGGHIGALGEFYRRGIEHSVLAQHIRTVLDTSEDAAVRTQLGGLDEAAWHALSLELAARLHAAAHFEVTDDNDLHVSVDAAAVMQAFADSTRATRPT